MKFSAIVVVIYPFLPRRNFPWNLILNTCYWCVQFLRLACQLTIKNPIYCNHQMKNLILQRNSEFWNFSAWQGIIMMFTLIFYINFVPGQEWKLRSHVRKIIHGVSWFNHTQTSSHHWQTATAHMLHTKSFNQTNNWGDNTIWNTNKWLNNIQNK